MVALGPLTWNAAITAINGDAVTGQFSGKWINYHDGGRVWREIQSRFAESNNGGFEHTESPWSITAPPTATGRMELYSDNDYSPIRGDYFALTRTPSLELDHPEAASVSAVFDPANPWEINYPNALGDGADIRLRTFHRRGMRTSHLIAIRTAPNGSGDARIKERIYTPLHIPNWDGSEIDIGLTGAALVVNGDPDAGIRIRPAMAWYRDASGELFTSAVSVIAVRRLGYVEVTKIIPRSFIDAGLAAGATVFADETTSVFFPNAHIEVSSVDGSAARVVEESFASLRSGAGTTAQDTDTAASCYLQTGATTSVYRWIQRLFMLFDTSSIGAGNVVSSATLSGYVLTVASANGTLTAGLVGSTPASNTAISASDYSNVGSTEFSSSRLSSATATTNAYNAYALNADGIAAISTTSVSKFAIRPGVDIDAGSPPWANAYQASKIEFALADTTGTTRDPKLSVTWSAAGGGASNAGQLLLLGCGA